jgi:hypothetical protein
VGRLPISVDPSDVCSIDPPGDFELVRRKGLEGVAWSGPVDESVVEDQDTGIMVQSVKLCGKVERVLKAGDG